MLKALDVQGLAGGFSLGVVQAGFKLIGKREQEGGFGIPAMDENRHLLGDDWDIEACAPSQWTPVKTDLLFGNPPCSGFSKMSISYGSEWRETVNQAIWDHIHFAAKCDPTIVIFESVQGAFEQSREMMQALRAVLEEESGHKFDLYHVLHNSAVLGGVQDRPRYFWVASRVPFGVELPDPAAEPETMRERIGDLQHADLGSVEGHMPLSAPRCVRLGNLAAGAPWYEGEHSGKAWMRNQSIEVDSGDRNITGGFTGKRPRYDKPSWVLDGYAPTKWVHPVLPRTITLREAARLMGFPDDWKVEPYTTTQVRSKWFGKGVTVEAGRWIAEAAHAALAGQPFSYSGFEIGVDEYLIDATAKSGDMDQDQALFSLSELAKN